MKIKDGVWLPGLKIEMQKVLINAEAVWRSHGQELVVTCGLDGEHSAGSLHYYGYALDLRTRYFDDHTQLMAGRALRQVLGPDYDVVQHPSHIHVEYDPAD